MAVSTRQDAKIWMALALLMLNQGPGLSFVVTPSTMGPKGSCALSHRPISPLVVHARSRTNCLVPSSISLTMATKSDGLVLGLAQENRFDSGRFCSPVVHKGTDGKWLMWYHGRDPSFQKGVYSQLTGRVGLCTSSDGVAWTRVDGEEELGSCLSFSTDPLAFDSTHVGVGDVVRDGDKFKMFYFGGSSETVDLDTALVNSPAPPGTSILGMRMRMGVASSRDGKLWKREPGIRPGGQILELSPKPEYDSLFSAWPRAAKLSDDSGGEGQYIYYTIFDPQTSQLKIAMARKKGGGKGWDKLGVVVGVGGEESFNVRGSNRCHVIPHPQSEGYIMFLEGVNMGNRHSIGTYYSQDGRTWVPGSEGAVLTVGEEGAWDSQVIGWPYAVPMDDGSCRLYYWGSNADGMDGIGLAVSNGKDWSKFTRFRSSRTRLLYMASRAAFDAF